MAVLIKKQIIMKTTNHTRIGQQTINASESRTNSERLHTAKPIEHRHERRKIREQLRRLNWLPGAEDEVFA